jgi:predicted PurR-regulated permease PerM
MKVFLAVTTFCLSVTVVVVGKPILAPIALACVMAFVLLPVVSAVERWGINRVVAVCATMFLVVIGTLLLASGLITQLREFGDDMPRHTREIESKYQGIRKLSGTLLDRPWAVVDRVINSAEEIETEGSGAIALDDTASLPGDVNVQGRGEEPLAPPDSRPIVVVRERSSSPLIQWVPTVFTQVFEPVASGIVVAVLAAFILLKREDMRNRVLAIIGRTRLSRSTHVLEDASERLSGYLLGLLSVNLGFSIAFTIVLVLLGVPYAAVWGSVSFFFRFVPIIGSAVSMLLPLFIAIATVPGWFAPLMIIVAYLSLEGFTGNVIEPWLYGKSVGMNPLAILIAFMFWTWAWGLIGLALATPLSLILVTLSKNISCLSWLDVLLGDSHPLPRSIAFYQRLLAQDRREVDVMMQEVVEHRGAVETMQHLILPALRRADREFRGGLITPPKYQAIIDEANEAVDKLVQIASVANAKIVDAARLDNAVADPNTTSEIELPAPATVGDGLRIATYDFGDVLAGAALRLLLANQPSIDAQRIERWTPIVARRLMIHPPDTILVSITRVDQRDDAVAFARVLRKNGFGGWIVLGWWKSKSLRQSTRRQFKEAGFDYVTHRMRSMDRMLRFAIENNGPEEQPTEHDDLVEIAAV